MAFYVPHVPQRTVGEEVIGRTRRIRHPDPVLALKGETFHWTNVDHGLCDWCGKPAAVKAFHYQLPNGRRRAVPGLYCSRNCWAQAYLNT